MSKAARSLQIFGIYLVVIGFGFLVVPNFFLNMFGFSELSELWIRVVAMLIIIVGYYYIQAALNELTSFFKYTVHGRSAVLVFFVAFVALGIAEPILILFGVIDLAGAIWTALALRSD